MLYYVNAAKNKKGIVNFTTLVMYLSVSKIEAIKNVIFIEKSRYNF